MLASTGAHLAVALETLVVAYRSGALLGGCLPLVVDSVLDGHDHDTRNAALGVFARATDVQTVVVTDDPEVMQSLAREGGTLVRWPRANRTIREPRGSGGGGARVRAASRMIAPETVKAIVEGYVDAYRRNDKQACIDLFAPDAVWHDPVGEPPHVGHEGIGEFWDQGHAMAESIELVPSDIIVCANQAAMVFEIHVTIAARSRQPMVMEMDAVEIFEIDDDGLISEMRAYWDMSRARTRAERDSPGRGRPRWPTAKAVARWRRKRADFRSPMGFGHNL